MRRVLLVPFLVLAMALVAAAPAQAAPYVERMQKRLTALGCAPGPADGNLGQMTRAALVRFQAANRLAQSGYLDERTKKALYAWKVPAKCDRRRVPAASGTGKRIVISQRQNYVWLVRADGTVAKQGGIIDNTRELGPGHYRVGEQCGRSPKIRYNTSGSLWLDYFVRFAPCGIGFHQIPRSKATGAQIHENWMLGTDYRESHGCIRLSAGVARAVWDWTTIGSKVVVVRG